MNDELNTLFKLLAQLDGDQSRADEGLVLASSLRHVLVNVHSGFELSRSRVRC